jgi:hypothetical protein
MSLEDAEELVGYTPLIGQADAIQKTRDHFAPMVNSAAARKKVFGLQCVRVLVMTVMVWVLARIGSRVCMQIYTDYHAHQ